MRQTSKVIHRLLAEASGQHRVRLDVRGGRQLQDSIGIAHDAYSSRMTYMSYDLIECNNEKRRKMQCT